MKFHALLGAGLTLMAAAPAAFAQDGAKKEPPCSDAIFRQFDFWLGDWDVYGPKGKLAGTNSITREENGCLLIEHWTSARGGAGQSYNFVDLETGKWRQIWVSPGTTIDYAGGLNDKGEMVLEGTIGYGADNPQNGAKFRGTWTANEDGSVTQFFQQYDPAGKEWKEWFKGTYKRRAVAE